jgi:hypothetical protein
VLVATVLLVLGLVADSGLGLIYVSIACSLAAGIILVVATRVNRPRAETSSPTPLPLPEPVPATAVTTAVVVADETAFAPTAHKDAGGAVDAVDDDMFPIADYDELSVGEIVPLLPKLYADELDVVEARESDGKARRQILARLAELRDAMAGAPDDLTAEEWAEQRPAPRRATVSKAATRKAAPARTAAAPVKKAAAPARKSAPVKKAAKKTAAPAKKAAPVRKAAAPVKKAATKAAAPAKKAAKTATKTAAKATAKATKKR